VRETIPYQLLALDNRPEQRPGLPAAAQANEGANETFPTKFCRCAGNKSASITLACSEPRFAAQVNAGTSRIQIEESRNYVWGRRYCRIVCLVQGAFVPFRSHGSIPIQKNSKQHNAKFLVYPAIRCGNESSFFSLIEFLVQMHSSTGKRRIMVQGLSFSI